MAKVKKCYFNIDVVVAATIGDQGGAAEGKQRVLAFRATQLNATAVAGANGALDRYGNFLEDLAALTGGSPGGIKARNAVSMWFQPKRLNSTGPSPGGVALDFIPATGAATSATALPYRTAGGGTNATLAGTDAIYTRQFRVRARIIRTLTLAEAAQGTVAGTIYVQRQHQIEV